MHKGQERANVKTYYEFGNEPMKMCFKHKTIMKVNHRIKDIKHVFLSCRLEFLMEHFFHKFLCFNMNIFFSPSLWFAFS
jgi:hypothetical protein